MLNLIGRGGFACVYRARSIKTGEEVAIKMIDKKLTKSNNMIGRVRREVEIHSRYGLLGDMYVQVSVKSGTTWDITYFFVVSLLFCLVIISM